MVSNQKRTQLSQGLKSKIYQLKINPSRIHLKQYILEAAQSLEPASYVLDAGSGDSPHRNLFTHVNYESTDFGKAEGIAYRDITYICDLASIPVSDCRYDLILCTQVLEHVPSPAAVLRELFRVLKPGKELWISAPLFYPEHLIPFDFFRYTQYGLSYLLKESGFEIKRLEWLEGYYGTLSFELEFASKTLPLMPDSYGGGITGILYTLLAVTLKPLFYFLSLIYERLDLHHKNTQIGHCKNYLVVAVKPHSPPMKT